MKRRILSLVLLLLIFLGLALWWKVVFWDKAKVEAKYLKERAAFSGSPPCTDFTAAANFDYMRLGRQLLSGSIAPDEYLALVRDRSRKLRLARTVPGWAEALSKGDRDCDLVPDDRDQCPDSPDLSSTDDYGCPAKGPLPKAPSHEEIERAKEVMRVAIGGPCKDAAPPEYSTPLLIGRDQNDPDSFYIAVSKTAEQPAGCPVFYDVRIRSERSSFFLQSSSSAHFSFVFRSSENVDHSPAAQFRNVFRVRKQNVPQWNDLVTAAIEPSDHEDRIVQVRMVNGNGLSRGWSEPRRFSINFLTQTFPPF